ncbi:MAG: PAS domain-containing sensor histidine kinase [Turicibacter sp.]|nr:PAS domain-containing sensor histidine kinase [Turicibacter sp.]
MRNKIFIRLILSTSFSFAVAFAVFFDVVDLDTDFIVLIAIILSSSIAINLFLSLEFSKNFAKHMNRIDIDRLENVHPEAIQFVRRMVQRQKQTEAQAVELSNYIDTINIIFDHIQEGFIMLDRTGVVILINQPAIQFLGLHGEQVGNNIAALTDDVSFLNNVRATLLGKGDQITTNMVYNFMPSSDCGAIITISSITKKQLEDKMQREFSANAAHEILSPIRYVAGIAEILTKKPVTKEDTQHFANQIKSESLRMVGVVENILLLSQIDEAATKEKWTVFDVSQIVANVVENLRSLAEEKQIEISLTDYPCQVYGNWQLIGVMFKNVILNSIEYGNIGGQTKVSVSSKNGMAYISVTDNGIGINKKEMPKVFDRFYKKEDDRATLGLSIVKTIVHHHGGNVDIESVYGIGTSIFIRFPDNL